MTSMNDLDFAQADTNPNPAELDDVQVRLSTAIAAEIAS